MTKRLRGWKKDIETGKAEVLEKSREEPNPFATKLLSLWAHGKVSAVGIQELAQLSQLGGLENEEVAALAKAGNYGQQPGNVHKAIMSKFLPTVGIPPGFEVLVPCLDKNGAEGLEKAQIFLPHTMFAALAQNYPEKWANMFSIKENKTFWDEVEKRKDDRLTGHPLQKEENWKASTIPCFVHGDGVEYQNKDSLMVWSWGSMLNLFHSLDSHVLMAAFPKSATTPQTWAPLWHWLAWSFDALQKGNHPSRDPDNKPLEKGSPFYPMRGEALAPGNMKAVIWSINGDQEFFSNVLGLPHWRNKMPCWQCNCTDGSGDLPYQFLDFDIFDDVDNLLAKENPRTDHKIFSIEGLTTRMVRGDGLHIIFTKGIYAHLLGSNLHYLCWFDPLGSPQTVKPSQRLNIIFSEIQKCYKEQGSGTQLTNLKLSMFTTEKSPHQQHAFLDAKGGECKWLAPALLQVMKKMLGKSMRSCHSHMIKALEALVQLVFLWDNAGPFLTEGEFLMSMSLATTFLQEYTWLNNWAQAEDRKLYHKVMKFHQFIHLVKNSRFINPRYHWCFKSEDFVGHCARLGHSVSMGVAATKLSTKVMPKYRILLHLLLSREGFTLEP